MPAGFEVLQTGYPPMLPPLTLPPKPPRDTALEPLELTPDLEEALEGMLVDPPESFDPTAGMEWALDDPEDPIGKKYQPA